MLRTFILLLIALTTLAVVSADIHELDGTCSEATHEGESIEDIIEENPGTHNCIDIKCAVVDGTGRLIKVSDGTEDADGGAPLRGNASYLLTESSDLRALSGVCRTLRFYESYCSVRNDWYLHVIFKRHYDKDESEESGASWDDDDDDTLIFGTEPPSISGLASEVEWTNAGNAYTCEDTLAPQLLFDERFDFNTGERNITLEFNDDESAYVMESGDTISLLMQLSEDNPDETMLSECWYAIKNVGETPQLQDRIEIECQGQRTYSEDIVLDNDQISGLRLWMNATDDQGNSDQTTHILDDYYEALGEGYCPRANECLIDAGNSGYGDGADIENNTFANYLSNGRVPVCVRQGYGVGNVYCSSSGPYERSQALFEYGIAELGESRGAVYCGHADRITPLEGPETRCSGLTNNECTLSCVLSLDGSSGWQEASALFASNNFLSQINDEPHMNIPLAFSRGLEARDEAGLWYLSAEGCQVGEHSFSCDHNTQYGPLISDDGTARNTVGVRYHNTTGLGSISQIRSLQVPSLNRIQTGHTQLAARSAILTSKLNDYLKDIALDTYENVPEYSATQLAETTRIAAYRSAGNKRILGISTNVDEFRYQMPRPSDPPGGDLFVVAVLYENFAGTARSYIDQAKGDIEIVRASPIRTIATPVSGSSQDSNYLLFVATRNEESAREMIERLVVRVRLE
jgi:hypothetical protein